VVKLVYPRTPTHKDCINFSDGICTFYGRPVDPNQPVCPNFTPKTAVTTPATTYQQPWFRGFGLGPLGWFVFPWLPYGFPWFWWWPRGRSWGRSFWWFTLPYLGYYWFYPYRYPYYWW